VRRSYPVDLHCHTTVSDGMLSPSAVVQLAARCGVQALAITDHDSIAGWKEAEAEGCVQGVKIVRGVEINTDWEKTEVHILGYFADQRVPRSGREDFLSKEEMSPAAGGYSLVRLEQKLADIQSKRRERLEAIIEKMRGVGVALTWEEVQRYASGPSIGRPHVARALVDREIAATTGEAFDLFLKPGAPAYVPRYKLDPCEAITAIVEAGGVAVLAHPGKSLWGRTSQGASALDDQIPAWIEAGLRGLEVCHPSHTPEQIADYILMADRWNLIPTGGSDFHAENEQSESIGSYGADWPVLEAMGRETLIRNKKHMF